ncbi:MAG: class I SAM-dependent methyltransferase [Paracoccaceae bacterium]
MAKVREHLFGGDPFAGADPSGVAPDLTGWGSTHPMFEPVLAHYRPRLVIEVGTWKGGSAIHMARVLRRLGVEAEIVCVDTWLGAPIAWTTETHLKPQLKLSGGYPRLYDTFLRNVLDAGVADTITPLPASSDGGFRVLEHFGVRAEVIYIDADHDYHAVKRDLENYWRLLAPGGTLIGDDFGCWPGVTRAVREFAEERDLYAVKSREKIALSTVDLRREIGLDGDGLYDRAPAAAGR